MRVIARICFLCALGAVLEMDAHAQAYCALRDPIATINAMMPNSTAHRSYIRTVRKEHQQAIREIVPFTVMNAELGQHTLYVVFEDDERTGFIHTRTEKGRFGLIEITWALDEKLQVVDFQTQRCRDPAAQAVGRAEILGLMRGRTVTELTSLLDDTGELRQGTMGLEDEPAKFTGSLVRSAIKTILVSRLVWNDLF